MQSTATPDLIVLGGGIAGLAAAWQAVHNGLRTVVIERSLPGGLVVNVGKLDGFPLAGEMAGAQYAAHLESALHAGDVQWQMEAAKKVTASPRHLTVETKSARFCAPHLIVATGARLRALAVPQFKALFGRGISQCGFCDAQFHRGARVVVVGAGDAAAQEALHLSSVAGEVVMVHRGRKLTARPAYRNELMNRTNVVFRWRTEVVAVAGDRALRAVQLRRAGSDEIKTLDCSGLFPFIGLEPNAELLADHLEQDQSGRVITDEQRRTSQAAIFAVGAVRSGHDGTLAAAVSDATTAVLAAVRA